METNLNTNIESLKKVASNFDLNGEKITTFERYGEGHINSTYLLILDNKFKYIFQKINSSVFKDTDLLMSNVSYVTEFLKNMIIKNGGDSLRETLTLVKTKDGKSFYKSEGNYYRIYLFVSDSITFQACDSSTLFEKSAIGYANFAKQLSEFDVSKLGEVIKDFHNTKKRFEHFLLTLSKDPLNRSTQCKKEIEFVMNHKEICSKIVDLLSQKKIPLRVTHNDTKLNNILFDKNKLVPLCVIDLDTVMPGSILYDFGDSIRFGCNPAGENEKDLTKVNFKIDYFEAFTRGYLSEMKNVLNDYEKENLAFSAILLTFECGIRFLDDYLDGDHYFHINSPDSNLVRARTQFKLISDMENCYEEMQEIVKKYS